MGFLSKPLVPIASCPVIVHPCEESTLIFIATFRYWKTVIRFPQAFSSWGWTNPVPSAFLHTLGSPAFWLSQWPGLSPVFSGSKDCIGLHFCTHFGTYMQCWVGHKTQPCMNILWKINCLLLCRAWDTCRTCCKSVVDQSCTQVSEEARLVHSSSVLSILRDTHTHIKSFSWKAGLTDLFGMLRPYGPDYLYR